MKIFINQTLKFLSRSCHTQTSILSLLHPWFITGFVDGEGCFRISVLKNKELKTQRAVRADNFT